MGVRWRVVVLGLLVVLLDGFDTTALGVAVPALARDWDVAASAFTLPLTAGSVGMVVSYLSAGALAARWGRRAVILAGTSVFAVGSAVTVLVSTPVELSLVRLLTGLGLGVVVPAAISLAADHSPERLRETVAVVVSLGLSAGPVVAGVSAGPLIGSFGWQSLFVVGALLPGLLLPWLWWGMREPVGHVPVVAARASVRGLFGAGLAVTTVLLSLVSLLMFATQGALGSWIPALLVDYGFSATRAPLGVAALGLGGLLGGLTLAWLTTRVRAIDVAFAGSVLVCVFVSGVAWLVVGQLAVLVLIGGVGFTMIPVQSAAPITTLSLYPGGAHTAAVGWTVACGRAGAVLGPMVLGLLMAAEVPARMVVFAAAAPPLVAAVLFTSLRRRTPAARSVDRVPEVV